MWIRLRQIAIVAHDLESVVADCDAALGLAVAFRDPGVATFGLHNAVMPAGSQFIEVVAPTQADTAGGRYLERRGGDGGYMVILLCDDHVPVKRRVDELSVRKVVEHDTEQYQIMQLHPRDTGGSFLEIDVQVGGESMDGPWEPAGPNWQAAKTPLVKGIVGVELQADDPVALAAHWAAILGLSVAAVAHPTEEGVTMPTIRLENATLRYVPIADGRGEGLGAIDVRVAAVHDVLEMGAKRGIATGQSELTIGGLRINPVT